MAFNKDGSTPHYPVPLRPRLVLNKPGVSNDVVQTPPPVPLPLLVLIIQKSDLSLIMSQSSALKTEEGWGVCVCVTLPPLRSIKINKYKFI